MTEPQPVVGELTPAAIFLVLTVEEGGERPVRDLLADLSGLVRTVGFRVPQQGLSCVAGIGAEVWPRLFDVPPPKLLHPFQELRGPRHFAPATPGDLLFHLRSGELGPCWELATLIIERLAGACRVVDATHGFGFFDRRDLLGFVDGTENPTGTAAPRATLDAVGGSYVIVQKYLHDMTAWNSLSIGEQERVIGRRKLDNVELDDAVKPPTSHVALTTITDPDGHTDRILDFSTAVTGGLFYAPPAAFLEDPDSGVLTEPEAEAGPADRVPVGVPRSPDTAGAPTVLGLPEGSLGIGNLTRSPT